MLLLRCLGNGHIVEVSHLLPADSRLLVLTTMAVDAVEVSVFVFLGEDSVGIGPDMYLYKLFISVNEKVISPPGVVDDHPFPSVSLLWFNPLRWDDS